MKGNVVYRIYKYSKPNQPREQGIVKIAESMREAKRYLKDKGIKFKTGNDNSYVFGITKNNVYIIKKERKRGVVAYG